jgi:hypothetical protein
MAGMFAAVFSAALLATAPAPDTPIPREPAALAAALATTSTELRQAIGRWRPKTEKAPKEAVLYALYQQRIYRLLAREDKLADATLPKLPFELRKTARDFLTAHRGLYRLTPPLPTREIKVGAPRPAGELLGYYREAQRRFRVSWNVLAAVNFVESKFGKLRSTSAAGAQGPMNSSPPRGARTASAATSMTRTTQSSVRPTTCARPARRATCALRFTTTTRRARTSTPCCATRGRCTGTTTSSTAGRSS